MSTHEDREVTVTNNPYDQGIDSRPCAVNLYWVGSSGNVDVFNLSVNEARDLVSELKQWLARR